MRVHAPLSALLGAALAGLLIACGDGPAGDSTPPTVESFSPGPEADRVSRLPIISARLSEPIDPASVNATTFTVTADDIAPIAGDISVNDRLVTFTPTAQLPADEFHRVRLTTGVRDLAGNALAEPVEWGFWTAHNTPPRVLSTSPVNGATNIDLDRQITARFSEEIIASAANVSVHSPWGFMDGVVEVHGTTLTFTPQSMFAMNAVYTVHLGSSIRDLEGASMLAGFNWSFTTKLYPEPETISNQVAVGMVVEGERVDVFGDVDEFHLRGDAGEEWVLFVQDISAQWSQIEIALLDSLTRAVLARKVALETAPQLEAWSTGRVVLPASTPYIIRMRGFGNGVYRFRIDAIHRAPEEAAAVVALGETVSEAIGSVADVDEFTIDAVAGQEVQLALQLLSGMTSGLTADLLQGGQVFASVATGAVTATMDEIVSDPIVVPTTGTYTIRVHGADSGLQSEATGTYRVALRSTGP